MSSSRPKEKHAHSGRRESQRPPSSPLDPHPYLATPHYPEQQGGYGYPEHPEHQFTWHNTGLEGAADRLETAEYTQEALRFSGGYTSSAYSEGYNSEAAVTYGQQAAQPSGRYPSASGVHTSYDGQVPRQSSTYGGTTYTSPVVNYTQTYTVDSLSELFAGAQITPSTGPSHFNRNVVAAGESDTGLDPRRSIILQPMPTSNIDQDM